MKYLMEFYPEVSYEPDTDKWRLFPESKLNQEWYEQFAEHPPLNQVQKSIAFDGDTLYSVYIESNSTKDAFNQGYELITNYIDQEEHMLHQTITCDKCKQTINNDGSEEFLTIDGYWKISNDFINDMHFHESCWKGIINSLTQTAKQSD